jgi:acyl carrier protein
VSEPAARLVRCFRAVFPDLEPDAIAAASVATMPQWDSLAMVTLVALLEREFAIKIDPMDLVECDSFEAISDYLRERGALA